MWGCFLMSGVKILHFLKDWWKSIPIHQNYTMALRIKVFKSIEAVGLSPSCGYILYIWMSRALSVKFEANTHLRNGMILSQWIIHHHTTGSREGCVPYPQDGACDVTLPASVRLSFMLQTRLLSTCMYTKKIEQNKLLHNWPCVLMCLIMFVWIVACIMCRWGVWVQESKCLTICVLTLQWNLVITRALGPWKLPCYNRFLIISG